MKQNDTLNGIMQLVLSRQLGRAIKELENFLLSRPPHADMTELINIRNDYQLMADYWQRGYDDPRRTEVYGQLLRRMYQLTSNVITYYQLTESAFLKAIHLRPRKIRKDWSMSAVRRDMEAFVSDVAMLQLEPAGATRDEHTARLYTDHWTLMRDLFDYILTSRQWRDSLTAAFQDMLLSPTLATIDQQLVISAITLSAMQNFCMGKFRVLAEVYRQSTDEALRQRALVGWALVAHLSPLSRLAVPLYPELTELVGTLCADEATRTQLGELQMQLIYCVGATADRDTIQQEILPDIIKGSNLRVTPRGLEENDDADSMDDILHPEASELAMERMEQSMKRMADMQKEGADIYFGGFSQMKRFPFFNDICNWFVPFYPQHPAISATWKNTRGKKFLRAITRVGAFCDSDKYSFVLAFNQVLDHLPQQVLKLIEQGEAHAMPVAGEVPDDEQQQPAFMRRMYLQNLYRFFCLYSARGEFSRNPFDTADAAHLFLASPLFGLPEMAGPTMGVVRFLMKRRRYGEALRLLDNVSGQERTYQFFIMQGTALQHVPVQPSAPSPLECFSRALQLRPDSERALAGLARAHYAMQDYGEALDAYRQLVALKPDSRTYQLGMAVCLVDQGQADEAVRLLFKLNYEQPDDHVATRALAWALTVSGKYEQADKLYCQLLALEQPLAADMLNYGYSLWLAGNTMTAIGMFRQFLSSQTDPAFSMADELMHTGHDLLAAHGISDAEIQLMIDASDSAGGLRPNE